MIIIGIPKKKGSRKGHCSHVFRTWTLEKGVGMFRTQLHRGWKMQALPPKRWNLKILNGFNRIRHILVRYGKHVQRLQVIRLPVLSGLISSTCSACIPELFECQPINTYQLIPCPRLQWGVSWLKGLWMWVCLARAAGPVSEKLKALRVSIDLGWWLWLWIKHPGFWQSSSLPEPTFLGASAG